MKILEILEDLDSLFGRGSRMHRLYNPEDYVDVNGEQLPAQVEPRPQSAAAGRQWDELYGGTHDPETGQVIQGRSGTQSAPDTSPRPPNRPSAGRAGTAFQFFVNQGLTNEQAAGFVGNLMAESGNNLDHTAVGDGGRAWGIAQWHPDRRRRWEQWRNRRWTQENPPRFEEQLRFIWYELQNQERRAYNRIRQTNDIDQAAIAVDRWYERSSGAHRQKRIRLARQIYRRMTGNRNETN